MTITTILLILAVVVVGYALYAFFTGGASGTPDYMTPEASCEEESTVRTVIAAGGEQPTTAEEPAPATGAKEDPLATVAEEEAPAAAGEKEVSATEPAKITEFRNPETRETAANPSNYRFAKKWIKQAMVDEGLLDKVYKNKELKGATEKKVKEALNRFKELKKYHG